MFKDYLDVLALFFEFIPQPVDFYLLMMAILSYIMKTDNAVRLEQGSVIIPIGTYPFKGVIPVKKHGIDERAVQRRL